MEWTCECFLIVGPISTCSLDGTEILTSLDTSGELRNSEVIQHLKHCIDLLVKWLCEVCNCHSLASCTFFIVLSNIFDNSKKEFKRSPLFLYMSSFIMVEKCKVCKKSMSLKGKEQKIYALDLGRWDTM